MSTPTNSAPDVIRMAEVQRVLGRCMLNLQLYESRLKAFLAVSDICGTADDWHQAIGERHQLFAENTLGMLVKAFKETVVVQEGIEDDSFPETDTPVDCFAVALRYRMEMNEEAIAALCLSLTDLVRMRNRLVHHFIQDHDLFTDDGCENALTDLTACDARIKGHLEELNGWIRSRNEANQRMGRFVETNTFQDWVVDGIRPDGVVDWEIAGIVLALKSAATALVQDGWTPLDEAVRWMAEHHPEQTPDRYGCRTWPHVLASSKQFDLQYRRDANQRKRGWFRVRVGSN